MFSISVDNGSNMLSAVRGLQQHADAGNTPGSFSSDGDIYEDEDENREYEEARNSLLKDIVMEFGNTISLIRCAVHTMQLAVTDSSKDIDENIRRVTTVAKNCR